MAERGGGPAVPAVVLGGEDGPPPPAPTPAPTLTPAASTHSLVVPAPHLSFGRARSRSFTHSSDGAISPRAADTGEALSADDGDLEGGARGGAAQTSFFEGRYGRIWGSCTDIQADEGASRQLQGVTDKHGVKLQLRAPKALYTLAIATGGSAAAASVPRWPTEMKFMYPGPSHLKTSYPKAEHYHPKYSGVPDQTVASRVGAEAYSCALPTDTSRRLSATRFAEFVAGDAAVPGGREAVEQQMPLLEQSPSALLFESRFESGNLLTATKIGAREYNLWLRRDLRTLRHTQWFYFRVRNMKAGATYKLNIVNLMKRDSLYNHGMQPVWYSEAEAREHGRGWRRGGHDICYFRNSTLSSVGKRRRHLYTLTFKFTATRDDDVVYFAHCYPYTYTDLQQYLEEVTQRPGMAARLKRRPLCQTLAGNVCELLTITTFGDRTPNSMAVRRGVVLTARVHPGETNASWMMKGFLDFILSDDPDAQSLRDNFVFKVVPMLNPDGVVVGNYRCNLSGTDLNRTYRNPSQNLHPTVFHLKKMIKNFARDRTVAFICDLHGHSRQHGVFIYGCDNRDNPDSRLQERVFPTMLHKNAPDRFTLAGCKFRVQASKAGTGRVVGWREYRVVNSFTMEATFCGSKTHRKQFSIADFESLGFAICDTLLDYFDPSPDKRDLILEEIREDFRRRLRDKMGLSPTARIDLDDYELESDLESSTAGSDSSPSESELPDAPTTRKQLRPITAKQRKRVRKAVEDRRSAGSATGSRHGSAGASREKDLPSRQAPHPTPRLVNLGSPQPSRGVLPDVRTDRSPGRRRCGSDTARAPGHLSRAKVGDVAAVPKQPSVVAFNVFKFPSGRGKKV